jgi:hypothetical protein
MRRHLARVAVAASLTSGLTGCGGESQRTLAGTGATGATGGSDAVAGGTGATGGAGGTSGAGASGGTAGTITVGEPLCPKDSEGRVVLPLSQWCDVWCPTTPEEAQDQLALAACGGDGFGQVTVTTGCGTVTVTASDRFSAGGYYFDAASGALLGAFSGGDITSGTCNTNQYYYGTIPEPCATAKTEYFCATGGEKPPVEGP